MTEKRKKDFPLTIHHNLNQLRTEFSKNFKSASSDIPLMVFKDTDEYSSFYFQINSFSKENDFIYKIEYKPKSPDDLQAHSATIKFDDLYRRLKSWISTIQYFDQTPHFFQDHIIESYAKEYFDEYKILEDDAETEPFDFKRQILIDQYLENSVKFLEKYQKENIEIDLTEPIEIANTLRVNLISLTKNEVIERLSKFWAVVRKKGLPIIKEVFFELAKELINEWGKKMLGM